MLWGLYIFLELFGGENDGSSKSVAQILILFPSPGYSRPWGWLFHNNRLPLDSSQSGLILEDEKKKVSIKEMKNEAAPN